MKFRHNVPRRAIAAWRGIARFAVLGLLVLPAVGMTQAEADLPTLSPAQEGNQTNSDWVLTLRQSAMAAAERYDYGAAELDLRRAIARFGSSPSRVPLSQLLLDLAAISTSQGKHLEAEALLRRAAPLADASTRDSDRAGLATGRAIWAAAARDYPTALSFSHEAVQRWEDISEDFRSTPGSLAEQGVLPEIEFALARNLEAVVRLRMADATSAYALAGQALLDFDHSGGPPELRADFLLTMGETASALGRLSAAEAYFSAAAEIRGQRGGLGELRLRLAMGKAYRAEGMNTAALIAYRRAFAIAGQLPAETMPISEDDIAGYLELVIDFAGGIETPTDRLGLFAEAFDAFELVRVKPEEQQRRLAALRASAPAPATAELFETLRVADVAYIDALRELANVQALPAGEGSAAGQASALNRVETAKDEQNRAAQRVAAGVPGFSAGPDRARLDDVRGMLAPDEAAIAFVIGSDRSFIGVVRQDGITIAPIALGRNELAERVGQLRRGLEIEGTSVADYDLDVAFQLYASLFGGVSAQFDGIKRVIIVPSGPLANLPFAALVTEPAESGDYANAAWLASTRTVSMVPSLSAFVRIRGTRRTINQPRDLLAVANPAFRPAGLPRATPPQTATATTDCQPGLVEMSALDQLPDTGREVVNVVRSLGFARTTVLQGVGATETAFRQENPGDYRILYLATHGVLPGEMRCLKRPAIALAPSIEPGTPEADGLFDTSEIATIPLRADLVVLSACNTASAGDGTNGEQLSSLADAFLAAGARSVMASLWKVPSASTSLLMSGAFGAMQSNRTLAVDDALRAAQQGMIQDPTTAHPFFWAAFVLLGDGATAPLAERGEP